MSRRLFGCLLILVCLLASGAMAQTIRMDEGYAAYDYPDDWLVLSPELCRVYAPVIREKGMDPEALALDMGNTHVLSCAYNADFTQRLAVQVWEEEVSQKMFDIGRAQTGDRRRQFALGEPRLPDTGCGMAECGGPVLAVHPLHEDG